MVFIISTSAKPINANATSEAAKYLVSHFGDYLEQLEVLQIRQVAMLIGMTQIIPWKHAVYILKRDLWELPKPLQRKVWENRITFIPLEEKTKLSLAIFNILALSTFAPDLSDAQFQYCSEKAKSSQRLDPNLDAYWDLMWRIADNSGLFGKTLDRNGYLSQSQFEVMTDYCEYLLAQQGAL